MTCNISAIVRDQKITCKRKLIIIISLVHWQRDQRRTPHHRLNDSLSHVLTATSLFYGKVKNSTPHRIKTPNLIRIKFGTVD